MSNPIDKYFSEQDLKQIEETVREAEKHTSGEIVPYVVHTSDPYDEALWRGGAAIATLALAILILDHSVSSSWQPYEIVEVGLVTLGGGILGAALTRFLPALRRFFAGPHILERRVAQRAAEAFLSEEVFNTRDRTGILIFLSLLEHKVIILGDSGINARVQKSEWEGVADTIVQGMRARTPAEGLMNAIRQCGTLLQKEGVAIRPDDTNELGNQLRRSDT